MELLFIFIIDSLVTFAVLYAACKITDVTIENKWLLIAVIGSAIISLIPSLGWVLSILFLFWVLNQYSNAKIWPDLIFMVVVSRLLSMFLVLPLF
jgi:hypothetical protein